MAHAILLAIAMPDIDNARGAFCPQHSITSFLILVLLLALAASFNQQAPAIEVAQVNDGLEIRWLSLPVVQMGADMGHHVFVRRLLRRNPGVQLRRSARRHILKFIGLQETRTERAEGRRSTQHHTFQPKPFNCLAALTQRRFCRGHHALCHPFWAQRSCSYQIPQGINHQGVAFIFPRFSLPALI